MDLTDPTTEETHPGWRPVLRALRATTEQHVQVSWTIDGHLEVTSTRGSAADEAVLGLGVAALERTCESCGRLGRPVQTAEGWAVLCGEHDPTAPSYMELWEALSQNVWFRDFEIGMVRVAEMTAAQRRDAIGRLTRDPVGLADQAQRHSLFRAARRRDRAAFDEALLIPADDETEARRMVEESPLMRALRRDEVDRAADEVVYRWGDVLDRLAREYDDE